MVLNGGNGIEMILKKMPLNGGIDVLVVRLSNPASVQPNPEIQCAYQVFVYLLLCPSCVLVSIKLFHSAINSKK
ncbi:hypothetical protein CEXT_30371 [Caerostris extrusa]|uniref:Uncharacterized protein n=1 Tax=Caerostris extrusa TaxID=172846 RepID=A0AAV4QS68_CAEEX|nr:hypothetical protein CEXT_30371 [Caerostris extrusa]